MTFSCNDAMQNIQRVVMKELCPHCPDKNECWDDWNGGGAEPDLETMAGCVCRAIYEVSEAQ